MGEKRTPRVRPAKEGLNQKEELDALEASVYSGLHPDYIRRLCRNAVLEVRTVSTPGGFYYLVKRTSLDSYLTVPHKRGPKRKEQQAAEETMPPEGGTHTEIAA